ncbi:MAG: helix-turn-helix domain-containing protein, partial [Kiritimatiellae bacterium]|nr:helix-turn-helix domain-containing protein [Kiritimatiellia bacterium]
DARFKRAVGRTIGAEIRAVRLAEVQRLLADPARQIKAIGDFCGFSAPGSLRKFFRRETGLSMREWRKRRS